MVRSLPTVPVAYWLVALSPCLTPPNALSSSGQPRAHVLTTHQHITHCYSLALPADGPMETCRARPPAGRLMSGKLRHHTRSLPTDSPRSPETKQPRLRRSVELHCLELLLVGGWLRRTCSAYQPRTRAHDVKSGEEKAILSSTSSDSNRGLSSTEYGVEAMQRNALG